MSPPNSGKLKPGEVTGLVQNLCLLTTLLTEFEVLLERPQIFRTQTKREQLFRLRILFCEIVGGLALLHKASRNHHPWHDLIQGFMTRTSYTVAVIHGLCEAIKDQDLPL